MEAMVARNLFVGYSLGELDPISVSHLQFADDTLLMGAKSWANVRALRALLVLFETMSGLKVKFNKSMLVGVNIPESWLGEAASALCCKVLGTQESDRWRWQPDPDTGYTVPLKVSIFAWRLLRDRLPTKSNLVTRGILSSPAQLCVAGCGEVESAHHLFISCSFFGSLWALVCTWIDIPLTDSSTVRDHFAHFTSSGGGSRTRRSFLQLIWLVSVWVIWTERNHRLFRGSTSTSIQLLDKIKLFSYRWLKSKNVTLALNYHNWWSSPLLCLGLV
ncbi:unnamed protein product [Trifolium pratense]|uniref:Uncharacterized protein n=1 Tax=Trifolium pratense TaxID=57577 RepID=A0ACB0LXH1_TRIPR|nr:unnamed protein product [Trifolium pratense]